MIAMLKNWATQLKTFSSDIFAFLSLILGTFLFIEIKRNKSDQELLKNDQVKQQVDALNNKVVADQDQVDTEEVKRKLLEDDLKRKENENTSDSDIASDLNSRK